MYTMRDVEWQHAHDSISFRLSTENDKQIYTSLRRCRQSNCALCEVKRLNRYQVSCALSCNPRREAEGGVIITRSTGYSVNNSN